MEMTRGHKMMKGKSILKNVKTLEGGIMPAMSEDEQEAQCART